VQVRGAAEWFRRIGEIRPDGQPIEARQTPYQGPGHDLEQYLAQLRIAVSLRERGIGPFATYLKTLG
jgi:hypothetical protein